jgi:hypothetical protein
MNSIFQWIVIGVLSTTLAIHCKQDQQRCEAYNALFKEVSEFSLLVAEAIEELAEMVESSKKQSY